MSSFFHHIPRWLRISVVVISFIAVVTVAIFITLTADHSALRTYTNSQFGFSFMYPAQWGTASIETVTVPTLRSSYQATNGNFWSPSGVGFSFSVAPLYDDVSETYVTPQQFVDYLIAQSPNDILTRRSVTIGGHSALEVTSVNGISHDETVYVPLNANDNVLILEADLTRLNSNTFNTVLASVHITE